MELKKHISPLANSLKNALTVFTNTHFSGLYAAAHDSEVPWVIIKGVSDFADGEKTKTSSWRPFASFMAASVAANILNDAIVFRDWSHYGSEYTTQPASYTIYLSSLFLAQKKLLLDLYCCCFLSMFIPFLPPAA